MRGHHQLGEGKARVLLVELCTNTETPSPKIPPIKEEWPWGGTWCTSRWEAANPTCPEAMEKKRETPRESQSCSKPVLLLRN